ncbi:MAG TPA: AI-2E family transporter [Casimicrobiaceae bacterium]|jgi:predicted PurR-regulated permease PerM|nr:AI-2E family transporter [Casimicrobiaceae bacterium]
MTPSSPQLDDASASGSAVIVVATARRLSPKHYLWVVGAVVVIAALLHWLGPILTPFLIGGMLAYVGKPAVSWMEGKRVPRTIGALLVMLVALVLVLTLLLVLAPLVHNEFSLAAKRLPELAAGLYAQLAPWLNEKFAIQLQFDLESIKQFIADNLDSTEAVSLKVLTGLKAGGMMVLGILINLVLIPVVMFYLLRDWSRIVRRLDELTPRRWLAKVRTMAIEIDNVLGEFLRGQLSVMGVLAIYYAIGLTLAGLQFALPIGILTGLLVFIPYVGFGLGLILGLLAALLQWNGWPGFAAVLAVYGIGQLLEGYVLIPWLVGDRIGLHPLVVIFALLAFGQLFGFAGVLLALPVSAALLVGLRHLRAEYHESPLYR